MPISEIAEILKSWPTLATAALAVLGALIKTVKSLIEFHDKHLQNRQLKHLATLAKDCDNQPLKKLIVIAKDEEVFRNLYGRSAPPEFISALALVCETGKFSLSELRISSPYLKLVNGFIEVELGSGCRVIYWVSIAAVTFIGLYTAALLLLLISAPSIGSIAAAVVLMAFYLFFAWYIGLLASWGQALQLTPHCQM